MPSKRWLGLILVLFLSACSSGKLVKTYEGDTLARDQVATLTAGENIVVLGVNGERVPDYLLSSISVDYGLKPGVNVVEFQYESIWGKAKIGADGSRSEAVESRPREVTINAKAGTKYKFRYDSADNVREARALAANFDAEVVNQKGQLVAVSGDVSEKKPLVSVTAGASRGSSIGAGENLPAIDAIKVLWSDLSAEEKKSFLKWAFQ